MFFGFNKILKKILPTGLFYRSLIIVAAPTIILQIIITVVFFDSIWIKANKGLTRSLVGELKTLSDIYSGSDAVQIEYLTEQFKFNYLDSDDFAKNWKNDTVCKLKYIGSSKATSVIIFPINGKTPQNEVIKVGVDRNIDKVFVQLQKKYPVFRPCVKIFSVGPVKAQIGLKDGVEAGQSYGILNKSYKLPKISEVKKNEGLIKRKIKKILN